MKGKHFLVYQITNLVNRKIYIGIHTTDNLEDGYFGSSVMLKNSLKKHGLENFKKEILFDFDNPEDMIEKERELVDDAFVSRKDTYNLNVGGGSFYYINRSGKSGHEKGTKARIEMMKDPEYRKQYCLKISTGLLVNNGYGFLGKKHKLESKCKIGEANSKHQEGKGNSQYGTCWIHNTDFKQSKKIKKEDLDTYLNRGWVKGRIVKSGEC